MKFRETAIFVRRTPILMETKFDALESSELAYEVVRKITKLPII